MSFWSSEKIKTKISSGLITPFDLDRIRYGAYELSLGHEAYVTSDEKEKKQPLDEKEQLVIPPGQFALLLTEEEVCIPDDTIGFISIKAGIKFRGLVNVSGFHVDPGFSGKLKFSVYNAGSQNIILTRNQPVFLIWFSDLDQKTSDIYRGVHVNQKEITSEDVMRIQGKVHSPATLDKRLTELEHTMAWIKPVFLTLVGGSILLILKLLLESPAVPPDQKASSPQNPVTIEETNPRTTNQGSKGEPEHRRNDSNTQQVPLQNPNKPKRN